jgi:hypothetical protein
LEGVMNASEVSGNRPWERFAMKWIIVLTGAVVVIAVGQPPLILVAALALRAVPKVRPESNSHESPGGKIRRFVVLCLILLFVILSVVSSATGVDYLKWLKPVYLYALVGLALVLDLAGDIRFLSKG